MATRTDRHGFTAMLLAASLLAGVPALAAQQADGDYADDYRSGDYGRLSDAERGVTLVRANWNEEQGVQDEGGINAPVFPGDRVTTADDQRAEIELADGTRLWIDRRTDVAFLTLPDPYAEVTDHTVLQLADGRLRVATALRDDEELRVDTPAASVYPVGDADVRVEVVAGGRTRVESRRGVVEVASGGASVLLRGGMRTEVEPGAMPYDPEPFNTFSGDEFDRYVERRESLDSQVDYAGGQEVYRQLPSEVRPYYGELERNGNWVYVDDYGYLWQPVGVATDWRPYYAGYWGYGPHGYFWISSEPWGWAPYHYGRWTWVGGYGWCWSPGAVFAGAWVSWSWGSAYVGWSPLDYWGYPAYRSVVHYGYYDPFCWTFVSYRHFHHHDYRHYSVGWEHVVHDVHGSAVVTRPPRVSPGRLASSADARARALRQLRDRPQRPLPRASDARPRGHSFHEAESGWLDRRADTRPRRDVVTAPAGRQRTVPPSAQRPGRRTGPAAGADRGRERLPVVRTPSRNRTAPSARPSSPRSLDRTPRSRSGAQAPQGDTRGDRGRSGISSRVRDIYEKMAKPRQTRERPATPEARSGSKGGSRPANPPRTRPKPSDPRKPSGRSQPKSGSGNERKARPQRTATRSDAAIHPSAQTRRTASSPATPRPRPTSSVERRSSRPATPSPSARRTTPSRRAPEPRQRASRSSGRDKTSASSRKTHGSSRSSAGRSRSSGSRGKPRGGSRRGGRR